MHRPATSKMKIEFLFAYISPPERLSFGTLLMNVSYISILCSMAPPSGFHPVNTCSIPGSGLNV